MFENLSPAPEDKILALMAKFRADPRTNKVDLGVGVYKNDDGETIVLPTVRAAEEALVKDQTTKTYMGITGFADFNAAMVDLILGDAHNARIASAQTVGGTGALRVLADLLLVARPNATVHVSTPTWPNHVPIMKAAGLKVENYPYFDQATRSVKFDELKAYLLKLGADDVVLLHGCCHNPTGANLTTAQWDEIAEIAVKQGFLPFVDLAYMGFGDGLEEDAYGVRKLASVVPEMMIAASCSKNFAAYRDRVGCAMVLAKDEASLPNLKGAMNSVIRANYSMPPHHGAAVVAKILRDPALKAQWVAEVEEMRQRMLGLRVKISEGMRQASNSDDFDFVGEHRGMFSLLVLDDEQLERLREEFGFYIVSGGRINIAGLKDEQIQPFCEAIAASLR